MGDSRSGDLAQVYQPTRYGRLDSPFLSSPSGSEWPNNRRMRVSNHGSGSIPHGYDSLLLLSKMMMPLLRRLFSSHCDPPLEGSMGCYVINREVGLVGRLRFNCSAKFDRFGEDGRFLLSYRFHIDHVIQTENHVQSLQAVFHSPVPECGVG